MSEVARHSRHARRRTVPSGRLIAVVLGAIALVAIGLGGGYALARSGGDGAAPVSPAVSSVAQPVASGSGMPARPTMIGDVRRVVTGDEIVVNSVGTDQTVRVLGLTTPAPMSPSPGGPAECGSREALQYADQRLTGQMVTLVPDPTQPELDDQGRRLAYVVLRSQLNYTDAALLDGIGRADTSRPLWYADVFAREQQQAVTGERGIWGKPCDERP